MSKSTTSVLAEHYIAIGREEKAAAIRTWLNAVGASLLRDYEEKKAELLTDSVYRDLSELRGAMGIVKVLLQRMNEASDAAPVGPCMCGRPEGHAVHDMGMPNGHAFQDSNDHPAAP